MYLELPFDASEALERSSDSGLAERFGDIAGGAAGAFSRNTERAVRSDLAIFARWCAERGLRGLPAEPGTVAAFVDAMAEQRAPATVRRYVASIVAAHRALGLEKRLKSPPVRLALKRMHRKKGRRQTQATGLTWPLRQRLMAATGDRLIDDRNRALLAVAYDTMLRRAELVSLQVHDLLEEIDGGGSVLVRRSKTDREGRGEIVWVGRDSLRLVRAWLDRGGIEGGVLFRFGRQGRAARRRAAAGPRVAHLQGDGARGLPAGGGGGGPVRAQCPGRRGPGHGGRRHRAAGDPPGRAVEIPGDGEPLRRAAAREAQRRCAAGPDAGAGLNGQAGRARPG